MARRTSTLARVATGFAGKVGFSAVIETLDFDLGLAYWRVTTDETVAGYVPPVGIARDATAREISRNIAEAVAACVTERDAYRACRG